MQRKTTAAGEKLPEYDENHHMVTIFNLDNPTMVLSAGEVYDKTLPTGEVRVYLRMLAYKKLI